LYLKISLRPTAEFGAASWTQEHPTVTVSRCISGLRSTRNVTNTFRASVKVKGKGHPATGRGGPRGSG